MFVGRIVRFRKPMDDGCRDLPYHRELPALGPDEEIAVVGEYALRRQIAVMSKAGVLVP